MYVYSVIEMNSFGHDTELKTFSNLVKALNFIEETSGTITHINKCKVNWYKEYCTEAKWAEVLLDKKDLNSTYYFPDRSPHSVNWYHIIRKKVY